MNYDIIIIGAGPGGIFTAYELNKSGKGYKTNGLIVMTMDYAGGDFTVETVKDTTTYKIIGSNVNLVATAQ